MENKSNCTYYILIKNSGGKLLGAVKCDGSNCVSDRIYKGGGGYPKVVYEETGIEVGPGKDADAHVEGKCNPIIPQSD